MEIIGQVDCGTFSLPVGRDPETGVVFPIDGDWTPTPATLDLSREVDRAILVGMIRGGYWDAKDAI